MNIFPPCRSVRAISREARMSLEGNSSASKERASLTTMLIDQREQANRVSADNDDVARGGQERLISFWSTRYSLETDYYDICLRADFW